MVLLRFRDLSLFRLHQRMDHDPYDATYVGEGSSVAGIFRFRSKTSIRNHDRSESASAKICISSPQGLMPCGRVHSHVTGLYSLRNVNRNSRLIVDHASISERPHRGEDRGSTLIAIPDTWYRITVGKHDLSRETEERHRVKA